MFKSCYGYPSTNPRCSFSTMTHSQHDLDSSDAAHLDLRTTIPWGNRLRNVAWSCSSAETYSRLLFSLRESSMMLCFHWMDLPLPGGHIYAKRTASQSHAQTARESSGKKSFLILYLPCIRDQNA